jgi:UDP-perosamine 4-acetyltransferase
MNKIVIIGGGGHSKVIISILKRLNKYEIVGYTDHYDNGDILGIPYLGKDDILATLIKKDVHHAVLGIGQLRNYKLRLDVSEYCQSLGYHFPSIVAPTAIVNENVQLDNGVVVMDGVIINPGTKIGVFSIINTKSSIDHDCQIGKFVHIAPGVTISGSVTIKDFSLIGTGSSVIQNILIEEKCIIGGGSAVVRNCTASRTYIGVPANRHKKSKNI